MASSPTYQQGVHVEVPDRTACSANEGSSYGRQRKMIAQSRGKDWDRNTRDKIGRSGLPRITAIAAHIFIFWLHPSKMSNAIVCKVNSAFNSAPISIAEKQHRCCAYFPPSVVSYRAACACVCVCTGGGRLIDSVRVPNTVQILSKYCRKTLAKKLNSKTKHCIKARDA